MAARRSAVLSMGDTNRSRSRAGTSTIFPESREIRATMLQPSMRSLAKSFASLQRNGRHLRRLHQGFRERARLARLDDGAIRFQRAAPAGLHIPSSPVRCATAHGVSAASARPLSIATAPARARCGRARAAIHVGAGEASRVVACPAHRASRSRRAQQIHRGATAPRRGSRSLRCQPGRFESYPARSHAIRYWRAI